MHRLFALCFISLALVSAGCHFSPVQSTVKRGNGQPDIAMVRNSDPKMNAAMDEPRRTAPQFIEAIKTPKPDQHFIVKVRVSDSDKTEYM